jgi:fructokinase
MHSSPPAIVGIGEILWDLFPTGPQLGGAPFNFVFHCHQLGQPSLMVSRVGADERGQAIREAVRRLDLSEEHLQSDPLHPTGTVQVTVIAQGQPTFTITPEVAYDYLAWDDSLGELVRQARAVCFGTLIQRHPAARATVQRLLHEAGEALIVCDINLRQHFFSRDVIEQSLRASRWLKLNDDELGVLGDLLSLTATADGDRLAELRRRYHLDLVCLTRGADGCQVQTETEEVRVPGIPVQVVDTVGAGDSFTAGLVTAVLEGQSLTQAATLANKLAAKVASSAGGTPTIDVAELRRGNESPSSKP